MRSEHTMEHNLHEMHARQYSQDIHKPEREKTNRLCAFGAANKRNIVLE